MWDSLVANVPFSYSNVELHFVANISTTLFHTPLNVDNPAFYLDHNSVLFPQYLWVRALVRTWMLSCREYGSALHPSFGGS